MASPCRKEWRKNHPFGFYAKPLRTSQGILDLKNWECGIPGPEKTIWEGGQFKLTMAFPDGASFCPSFPILPGAYTGWLILYSCLLSLAEYPTKPPKCKLTRPTRAPNSFQSLPITRSMTLILPRSPPRARLPQ